MRGCNPLFFFFGANPGRAKKRSAKSKKENGGTKTMQNVYLLKPLSDAGREWIKEHVNFESWQRLGEGIGIEHRFIHDIVDGMTCAGLIHGIDYAIEG